MSDRPDGANTRGRLIAAFAAVYIIWGSTYLAIRYAVQTIPPFLMAGTRFAISGAALYAWARFREAERPTRAQWKAVSVVGLLMLFGGNGAVVWAEQRVPSGIAALLVAIVPVWMVLLDWARPQGKRPSAAVFIGLALGLAGLVLLVGPGALAAHGGVDTLGSLVLVAGSLFWASGSVYSRYGAHPRSAILTTGMQMLAGAAAFLLAAVLTGELHDFHPTAVSPASAIGLAYLVTFGSLIGFTAYVYLLRATTPAKASTYAYVNPVVAVLLGWAVAGEPVTARTLMAAAVILAGVAIITRPGRSGRASPRTPRALRRRPSTRSTV